MNNPKNLILLCLTALFILTNALQGQDEKGAKKVAKLTKAEKVFGKFLVASPSGVDVAYEESKFILISAFVPVAPPNLPKDFEKRTQEQRTEWYNKFIETEEGKKYREEQEKAFANRTRFKILIDNTGEFSVKNVPVGQYSLEGTLLGKKDGKDYAADIFANIEVRPEVEEVKLGEIEVSMLPRLKKGETAPDFVIKDYSGKSVQLSKFRGKTVLLQFWTSKIAAKGTLKVINDITQTFANSPRFAFIGVSLDEEKSAAEKYLKVNKVPGIQLHSKGWANKAPFNFGVRNIPSFWIIDPKGKIAAVELDFYTPKFDIEKAIRATMK